MALRYTAKIYHDKQEVAQERGNDVDELYHWLLMKTQGMFNHFHGEIIDNKTGAVVKSFRKSSRD